MWLIAYSPLAGGRLSGKYIGNKKASNARYTIWPRRFDRHHTKRGELLLHLILNYQKNMELHHQLLLMLLLMPDHL